MNQDKHINWLGLATIWFGGMISVPSLMIGSTLIHGLGFFDAMLAGFIGFCVVALFMSLESVAAVEQRLSTVPLASSSFGRNGANVVVGAVVAVSLLGWFGVQAGIAGASFSHIMGTSFGLELPASLSSFFWGCFMMLTAVFGFRYLKYLNYLAVPCKVFLVGYGVWAAFQGKGFDVILNYRPAPGQEMDMLTAIGLSIGFFSVGGVISPDYAKHAATRRDAVWGSVIGLLPVATSLAAAGALLAILQSTYDIVEIFAKLGMPVMALSVLIIATWTSNVMNAYSAGLALNQVMHWGENRRAWATAIVGVVGSGLAAAGILNDFMSFLMLLTVSIPPVAGVLVSDYWLVRRYDRHTTLAINWRGILAWGCGVAVMLVMTSSIRNVLGIVVAAAAYALFVKLAPVKTAHARA